MVTIQLQFDLDKASTELSRPPQSIVKQTVSTTCSNPPTAAPQAAVLTVVPEQPKRKKTNNLDYCNACGDQVAMINRKGIKLAWSEDCVVINGVNRTLYWCEPCSNTATLEQSVAA